MEILPSFINEPNFMLIEFAFPVESGSCFIPNFEFNLILENSETKSKFDLIATINQPWPNHFNCGLYKPMLKEQNQVVDSWCLHDTQKKFLWDPFSPPLEN